MRWKFLFLILDDFYPVPKPSRTINCQGNRPVKLCHYVCAKFCMKPTAGICIPSRLYVDRFYRLFFIVKRVKTVGCNASYIFFL